jgi:hypothetical protein
MASAGVCFAWAGGLACRRGSRTGVRYPDPSGRASRKAPALTAIKASARKRPGRHGSCSTGHDGDGIAQQRCEPRVVDLARTWGMQISGAR